MREGSRQSPRLARQEGQQSGTVQAPLRRRATRSGAATSTGLLPTGFDEQPALHRDEDIDFAFAVSAGPNRTGPKEQERWRLPPGCLFQLYERSVWFKPGLILRSGNDPSSRSSEHFVEAQHCLNGRWHPFPAAATGRHEQVREPFIQSRRSSAPVNYAGGASRRLALFPARRRRSPICAGPSQPGRAAAPWPKTATSVPGRSVYTAFQPGGPRMAYQPYRPNRSDGDARRRAEEAPTFINPFSQSKSAYLGQELEVSPPFTWCQWPGRTQQPSHDLNRRWRALLR